MKKRTLLTIVASAALTGALTLAEAAPQSKAANLPPPDTSSHAKANARKTPARTAPGLGAFKPAGKSNTSVELQVPKGAQQIDASTWRWTDPQGTPWIYRRTPFGLNHYRENEEKQRAAQRQAETNPARVTDAGDSYKFERSTPFGLQSWTKKKTDLNDSEKEMLKEAQAQASAKAQQ